MWEGREAGMRQTAASSGQLGVSRQGGTSDSTRATLAGRPMLLTHFLNFTSGSLKPSFTCSSPEATQGSEGTGLSRPSPPFTPHALTHTPFTTWENPKSTPMVMAVSVCMQQRGKSESCFLGLTARVATKLPDCAEKLLMESKQPEHSLKALGRHNPATPSAEQQVHIHTQRQGPRSIPTQPPSWPPGTHQVLTPAVSGLHE